MEGITTITRQEVGRVYSFVRSATTTVRYSTLAFHLSDIEMVLNVMASYVA